MVHDVYYIKHDSGDGYSVCEALSMSKDLIYYHSSYKIKFCQQMKSLVIDFSCHFSDLNIGFSLLIYQYN